jgi:hypothetical protein
MERTIELMDLINNPPKPKKPKMKDIFIFKKSISLSMSNKELEKKTVVQLRKMAKEKGVSATVANKMRKAGLVDVLGKDNKMTFAVPKKGEARVGKQAGARLAYHKKKKSKK